MNKLLKTSWWIFGTVSALCMLFCSAVGYYGLLNVIILGTAAYTLHLAAQRHERWQKIAETAPKMTRKERKVLKGLDEKEVANIHSLAKMMPYLCFGSLLLDGYAAYYNHVNQISSGLFGMHFSNPANIVLFAAGLMTGVVFYFAWCLKMNSLMDLQ